MPPKKKTHEVTLALEAGNAAMVDLGKMLGPTGANMRAVKVEYDEATSSQRGEIIPVVVTVFEDRSHKLTYKTPPTSFLIRKALGVQSGASNPGTQVAGTLTADQIREIAKRKLPDLNANDEEAAIKVVAGTARSMGVNVPE
ncbi:uL11 family ribosomal protein [Spirilliplanes yamanashiensis]|jgi:large subunit ribosomal protein L11|uniref:Large ribosomal subunit protein uL11 n=1 Tax=Spirilliplanes yamanashiensis TaxID=42233 RepID=A0A8J4DJS2_9ACTN|nr:50S ribosomal protein L11 [Spirilliplanes yamanashiensis]MDP9817059.1 large subunit ribosomal protein L11 [Spirilliplanes yamanashiensis]GIJ03285.1 50S ribosomal protein L11 [Spirilliplanes yamanashiensis]